MEALSPRGSNESNGESMAAKLLLGVSLAMTGVAGFVGAWAAQDPPPTIIGRDTTFLSLTLVVGLLVAGIGAAVRLARYMDDRGRRIGRVEEICDRLQTVILGSPDPDDGLRRGGLVEKVDRILACLEAEDEP